MLEARPVAIISSNLARELWGNPAAALGKRIRERPNGIYREIVGVASQERDRGVDHKAPQIAYWPLLQRDFWKPGLTVGRYRYVGFAVRSPRTGSKLFMQDVQRAVWAVNPQLPLSNVKTVQEFYDRSLSRTSFTLVMISLSAAMALAAGRGGHLWGDLVFNLATDAGDWDTHGAGRLSASTAHLAHCARGGTTRGLSVRIARIASPDETCISLVGVRHTQFRPNRHLQLD